MSKAKIRSMQRGARKRDRDAPIDMQALYRQHPPKIASADKPHLDFIRFGKLHQVERIKTVVLAAEKNNIGSASEISSLLNKLLIKTAIGEKWTPRLAWFVTSAIRTERSVENKAQRASSHRHEDAEFRAKVNRVIKSRLDEIREEFENSAPTLGDANPELAALRRKLGGD